ncbi:MAG: hypothetical protein HFF36_12445 [Coprobacillus sp.]|jgi:hypothetical protein|nr:hypothetical protein [Coprobacillus sp.]MCI9094561.1 hypothetical protein [Coprobacillus sp.]
MNNETCIEELLNGINMGMIAIDHLVDKIENARLRDIVIHQRKAYGDLKEKIQRQFPQVDDKIKQKFMLESMIELKTMLTDDAKIAKMLTEGCNQAIMTVTHLLNKENNIDMKLRSCVNDFEEISEKYLEELKAFL